MRFMVMHKMTEQLEKGLPPTPEEMAAIGKFIEGAAKENIFLGGEGLKPTAQRVHIAYKDGERTVTDGPFTEAKELVAGFALMRVKSKEEAIAWCDRFGEVLGNVELFMGPVVEYWDLGMGVKPENAPLRFLSMHQMDERAENESPMDPVKMQKMRALVEEMTKAGVLESTGGLASTRKGARIHFEGGKHRVIDGPFAESKELVAGYALMELPSIEAAIDWAIRFGEVVDVHEIDVRQMCG